MTNTEHHNKLLLVCFFLLGSSAWVLVNGLYAEIPLIVAALEYDYSVISKLTLCITLTSVAPIFWSLILSSQNAWGCSNVQNTTTITKVGITLMLALGTATALGLSLSDAALRQTTLLVTSVCSGLVGTMSNVLYYPHAATTASATVNNDSTNEDHQQEEDNDDEEERNEEESPRTSTAVQQTTAMASGIASASLFVAVLAIVQQQSLERLENFSLQAFFGVITAIFTLAVVGFGGTLWADRVANQTRVISLEEHKIDKKSKIKDAIDCDDNNYGSIEIPNGNSLFRRHSANVTTQVLVEDISDLVSANLTSSVPVSFEIQEEAATNENFTNKAHSSTLFCWTSFMQVSRQHMAINAGQFVLNLLTFFLPGIIPYAVYYYEDSQRALHYLTVTQLIAQTLGTLASGWKQSRSVGLQLVIYLLLWIPTVTLSFVNNTSFQQSHQASSALPITLNAMLNFGYGYSSTTFYHLVHADAVTATKTASAVTDNTKDQGVDNDHDKIRDSNHDPHIASRVLGSWNQLGAMLGSLIAYFLVETGAIS